jgi:hypothetical protein
VIAILRLLNQKEIRSIPINLITLQHPVLMMKTTKRYVCMYTGWAINLALPP